MGPGPYDLLRTQCRAVGWKRYESVSTQLQYYSRLSQQLTVTGTVMVNVIVTGHWFGIGGTMDRKHRKRV